jgi:hypothetical protein
MDGLGEINGARWLRPVDLNVTPEAILAMRLAIPTAARRDFPHAVGLAIRQDTPFEPDELLVQALEVERDAGSETYLVNAVPKRLIEDAARRVGHIRLGRIGAGGNGIPDLAEAMFPWRRPLKWLTVLPLMTIFGVAATGTYGALADLDQKAAAIGEQVAATLAELRHLSGELDAIDARAAAGRNIATTIAAVPPAFLLLERARHELPTTTEVTQAELGDGELRLSLRSEDALGDMAGFIDAGWSAAVDGAITSDPTSGREIVVLRLSPTALPR